MFKIAIAVFRECLEISLLLGIIMALTKPIKNSRIYIIFGILVGIVAASIFTFLIRYLSEVFFGLGDELFNACIILITAIVITWTVAWAQGYRRLKYDIESLSERINSGIISSAMLVLVVATSILREGAEILLLVYSISSAENININDYIIGIGCGASLGFIAGIIIYLGLIKFAGKYVFKVSTILLVLIAAGLAAQAAGIFTSSGLITILSEQIWDSSWLINDNSTIGNTLNILIGYQSKPNILQIIFYLSTIMINVMIINIRTKQINNHINHKAISS